MKKRLRNGSLKNFQSIIYKTVPIKDEGGIPLIFKKEEQGQ